MGGTEYLMECMLLLLSAPRNDHIDYTSSLIKLAAHIITLHPVTRSAWLTEASFPGASLHDIGNRFFKYNLLEEVVMQVI